MTTAQIASEAGVSIGALYRFFPDKQAIVDGLATRLVAEFQVKLLESLGPKSKFSNGAYLLAHVIDAFVVFLDNHPEFVTIAYGGRHISESVRDMHSGSDTAAGKLIKRYMTDILGVSVSPELDLRLRLSGEVGDRLIGLAMQQSSLKARREIIEQLKLMLSRYLFDRQ